MTADSYSEISGQAQWEPYEDTPEALRCGVRARWVLAHPLQRVVWRTFTVGEVILCVAGLACLGLGAWGLDTSNSGSLAQLPVVATFAFAARNSPLTFLLGIPFERRVAYHKNSAAIALLCAYLHGGIGLVSRDATASDNFGQLWTGLAAAGCATLLGVTSHYVIRRRLFDAFYFTHWVLFTGYVVFLMLHSATTVLIGVSLWGIDVALRTAYMALFQPGRGTLRHVEGTNVVEISMEGVKYGPGQYAFLAVPEIGCFQWHPISFSSAPCEGKTATFYVRCNGDWGARLLALAEESGPTKEHRVLVDGAYGNTSIDIDSGKYKHFLLVAGGIGVTPLRSIAASLVDQNRRGREVRLLEVHWSVRDNITAAVPMKSGFGLTVYDTGSQLTGNGYVHPVVGRRMDVDELVKGFKGRVKKEGGQGKVAVLFCGPGAMFTPLRMACKKHSCESVSFDLHTETFDL